MRKVFNIVTNKNFLPIIIVLAFATLAARSLLFQSGYFNMHDDLQMMRQLELEKCFQDGQIPCRWIPDMGYGFGFPLFNFYPPLPYLVGELFRLVGLSFVTTAKLIFALSFFISGVGMYLFSKEFFGRVGGVLSSIFYIWAPYHSVDIYVRGAMNEAWALSFFPLIFWASYKLIIAKTPTEKSGKPDTLKWFLTLTLSYAALLLSHNLMVMIFTPFMGVWILMHVVRTRNWKKLPIVFLSGLLALGLAAFFTFPALFENQLTHVRSQLEGYYNYSVHFVSINQLLISRFWGYGPSVWGTDDGMSFQVGQLHWILSVIVGLLLVVRTLQELLRSGVKKSIAILWKDKFYLVTLFLLVVGWISAFMTHEKSVFIYKLFSPLEYVQFPWRFLTVVIFAFSFVVGYLPGVVSKWRSKHNFFVKFLTGFPQFLLVTFICLFLVVINWNYFKPEHGHMGPLTDAQKFSGLAWQNQQTSGIYDYLPATAQIAPTGPKTVTAEVMHGDGIITNPEQSTYWSKFDLEVESGNADVRIDTLYFPGWHVYFKDNLTTKEIQVSVPDEEYWGRMWINLPKGNYSIYAQFMNTPIRTYSNIVTVFSLAILVLLFAKLGRQNRNVLASKESTSGK